METRRRLMLILFLSLISLNSIGQPGKAYHLHDIVDDLIYSVFVIEDLEKGIATIVAKADTVEIYDIQEIRESVVHFNKFLEIQFRVRGGSGVRVREKVLLCVSRGKIFRTLDILSDITSRVTKVYEKEADSLKFFDERQNYHVTISMKQKASLYKVVLIESDTTVSKFDPSQDKSFEKSYTLDFDPVGCFFYNSTMRLDKSYKVYSRKQNKEVEKFINVEVPCIQLDQAVYVLINNEWCSTNRVRMSCR